MRTTAAAEALSSLSQVYGWCGAPWIAGAASDPIHGGAAAGSQRRWGVVLVGIAGRRKAGRLGVVGERPRSVWILGRWP